MSLVGVCFEDSYYIVRVKLDCYKNLSEGIREIFSSQIKQDDQFYIYNEMVFDKPVLCDYDVSIVRSTQPLFLRIIKVPVEEF